MLNQKEREIITNKFKKYIGEGKIKKPKHNKKEFFKNKAENSIKLAKELIGKEEYFDWIISIAYYSMFYNAITLLAHINVDLGEINENVHVLTYQALIYFFHIDKNKIELHYLEEFKESMEESDIRIRTLAKIRSEEILSSYRNAKAERGKVTYELGQTAALKSANTAIRRAEAFDILSEKLMTE